MAGGNLGDLFISLGIKDEMSKTLQKIVKGMKDYLEKYQIDDIKSLIGAVRE